MIVRRLPFIFMLLALVLILLVPDKTYAHASLIEAIPAPNSTLAHSPSQIGLHFNERVENELFYIHMLDQNGEPVTERDAALNLNQHELYLDLPSMKDGIYTVSYQVISSDGHPIKGVYTITIGDANVDHAFNMEQPSHLETITHGNISSENAAIYISRMLYMLSLLTVTGWVFWRNVIFENINHLHDHRRYDVWGFILQGCLLVTLIVMVGFQSSTFIDVWNWDQLGALLFKTTIGWTWLMSFSLSIVGFFLLFRYRWIDFGWVFLVYMAKSCNGHSMIFEPTLLTIPLNIIHLFAAAIWAGGLMYTIVHGRRNKKDNMHFLSKFSTFALYSIIALVISGICSTLIYLPNIGDILNTQWGIMLMIKIVLVIFVILVGLIMRMLMRRNKVFPLRMMLKVDFTLMILIIAIVGIFTYLSPVEPV